MFNWAITNSLIEVVTFSLGALLFAGLVGRCVGVLTRRVSMRGVPIRSAFPEQP
jgi:hypothetical protein